MIVSVATEKRKKLKRQLIEEDISYVVVSKITEGIKGNAHTHKRTLNVFFTEINLL
jgi:signal recognition particle GTPase